MMTCMAILSGSISANTCVSFSSRAIGGEFTGLRLRIPLSVIILLGNKGWHKIVDGEAGNAGLTIVLALVQPLATDSENRARSLR